MRLPQLDEISSSLDRLASLLQVVEHELVDLSNAPGRVLAEPLRSDRDSPAMDVSAMDGFAARCDDLRIGRLPIVGTSPAGAPPLVLEPRTAIRIFTGAPIPEGANCVIKREDTTTDDSGVVIVNAGNENQIGQNVRHQGKNAKAGEVILESGTLLSAGAMAAVASFAGPTLTVRKKLRVGIINTGDELVAAGEPVQPWQIRDSNGPTLEALLKGLSWLDVIFRQQVEDKFDSVKQAISRRLPAIDALLLTGGVSMGDCDFVPQAIQAVGGQVVFHRLPIRPGRPVLGAVSAEGKLVMGLPGNPVSVAVTVRRLALPLLRRMAGFGKTADSLVLISLAEADEKSIDLVWYRLVTIDESGCARLVDSQGSGDLVSLARSAGFIELLPNSCGVGPWPFRAW